MIFGFDTENAPDGRLLVACLCSRTKRLTFQPGPQGRMEFCRVLELSSRIEPVHVWSVNLQYDFRNFYGADLFNQLTLHFGRKTIVGARMKGLKVFFFDVTRFFHRKTCEELGQMLRFPKFKVDPAALKDGKLPAETLARYCMRDAQIARKAGEAADSEMGKRGVAL